MAFWAALLKAFLAAVTKNAEAAQKGEPATATLNPVDLATAMAEKGGGKGEGTKTQTKSQTPNVDLGRIVVPGPSGRPIQGQGEVMPGYEMQPPQYKIPPQYLNMPQAQGQPSQIPSQYQGMGQQPQQTERYPGVFAGLKEGILGMPSSVSGREPLPTEQGRQTAYYAGKLIPDIIRSKMGVSTTGEEARQGQMMEAYGVKKFTPQFKNDLSTALSKLSPNASEQEKVLIFNELVKQYPEKSVDLKRILFPTSKETDWESIARMFGGMK